MTKKWEVKVIKDGEDFLLPLPDEVLKILGLAEGDFLNFEKKDDGTYQLSKAKKSEKTDNCN